MPFSTNLGITELIQMLPNSSLKLSKSADIKLYYYYTIQSMSPIHHPVSQASKVR